VLQHIYLQELSCPIDRPTVASVVNLAVVECVLSKCNDVLWLDTQGHEKEALHLMSTYLPKETGPGSVYSEGGGLYALGEC